MEAQWLCGLLKVIHWQSQNLNPGLCESRAHVVFCARVVARRESSQVTEPLIALRISGRDLEAWKKEF